MKLNRSKRNDGHHLPCLSSLSQAPLINDSASEKLTPILAHTLNLQSPIKISHQQLSCSTPQMLSNSATLVQSAIPNSNLFFPPLPPRTPHAANRSHSTLNSTSRQVGTSTEHQIGSTNSDLNMNLDQEKNRENQPYTAGIVQPAPRQSQAGNNSTKFFSPSQPSTPFQTNPKSVQDFFPDTFQQTLVPWHDTRQPPLTPLINLSKANENGLTDTGEADGDWSQPDENYHLYHELIDIDEDRDGDHFNADESTSKNMFERENVAQQNPTTDNKTQHQTHSSIIPGSSTMTTTINNITGKATSALPSNFLESLNRTKVQNISNSSIIDRTTKNTSSSTSVPELPLTSNTLPSSPSLTVHLGDHCIRELLVTESNYVHALSMIINCFAKPLEPLLRRDENQLIFGHIKYFHHIHSSLQTELKKAANRHFNVIKQVSPLPSPNELGGGNRAQTISSCFLNVREKFLKYGEYCASLSRAQALLDELTSRNDTISSQLEKCQQEANEGRFKLRDLLSLPMQRILKYHLLLAQLIKNTSSSDEDHQGLKRAHEVLVNIGQYINEVRRDTEAMQVMDDIEQTIIGLNLPRDTKLIDYGRLITDGSIKIRVPQEAKSKSSHEISKLKLPHDAKIKQRYVFVFDKVILMCKDSGLRGSYQYKEALVLDSYNLEVNPVSNCETLDKHILKEKYNYIFNLTRIEDRATYSFYPKSIDLKNKWVSSIQRALDNIRPAACRNVKHKFQMHTFQKASSCDHCGKLLLGLYYQGYRCGACFTKVHKKCITYVRPCGPPLPPKPGSTRNSTRSNRSFNEHTSYTAEPNRYANFVLDDRPWFCGRMDRDKAQSLLETMPHETFLVRMSPKHNSSYVISLNFESQVKHMRINISKDNQLYLSENRFFKSVVELVSYYEKNSLVESFHMLDARLSRPFKEH